MLPNPTSVHDLGQKMTNSESSNDKQSLSKLGSLAILGQCFYTGTNFLTAVLVGRWGGAVDLGEYSLAFSIAMILYALQRAILIAPFVVIKNKFDSEKQEEIRGSIVACTVLFAAAGMSVMLAIGYTLNLTIAYALAFTLFAGLLRELVRQLAIAELSFLRSLVIDVTASVIQLTMIVAVSFTTGAIQAEFAIICIGVACAVVAAGAIFHCRSEYTFRRHSFLGDLALLWPVGRWVGVSQMLATAQAFLMPWIMALCHSIELAGIYAACWTLVQFVSPAIEAIGNVLNSALAFSVEQRNWAEMRSRVLTTSVIFAAIMGGVLILAVIFGHAALLKIYGTDFANHSQILIVLAISAAISSLGFPMAKLLIHLGYAAHNFGIVLVTLIASAIAALILLPSIGVSGAAWALVLGATVATLSRLALFVRCMNRRMLL